MEGRNQILIKILLLLRIDGFRPKFLLHNFEREDREERNEMKDWIVKWVHAFVFEDIQKKQTYVSNCDNFMDCGKKSNPTLYYQKKAQIENYCQSLCQEPNVEST
jgi:hypothetical protein